MRRDLVHDSAGKCCQARALIKWKKGKLEAVKVPPRFSNSSKRSLRKIYTRERNEEELAIQKGCSCEVPDDFPQ